MPEHWAPTTTRTSRKCSVIAPGSGNIPGRQCTPRSTMTQSTQHRNVPWAPRQEKNTNSTQNTNGTQWSQSVQHPQCKMPFSTHNVRACRSPLSNVPALFCCEGEVVQAVCTHNAQSVISLFGVLMVDVTKGQSAAHTHEESV